MSSLNFPYRSYFPHWTPKDIEAGAPWDLYEMQGRDNIIWIGGGPAMGEYMKPVIDYNNLIFENLTPSTESCRAAQPPLALYGFYPSNY